MALVNEWVGYLDRSYSQIKDAILSKFPAAVPEMTDHTESNPFVRMISVWAGITEQLGYYIDNTAREAFLSTCTLWESGVSHAADRDYRIKAVIPATVDLRFYLENVNSSNVVIPIGTETTTAGGIIFRTLSEGTIVAGATEVVIPASNIILEEGQSLGLSTGVANQIFVLGADLADTLLEVLVAGTLYTFVESFGQANEDDKVFTQSVNGDREVYILFGDGINGKIPPINNEIVINYFLSSGAEGNVTVGTINTISSSLTLPTGAVLKVKNASRAAGGAGIETLADLKRKIPMSVRTLNRAVSETDYVEIALLTTGVAQALQDYKCGKTVPLYIVPNGGGIASQTLLKQVELNFENKRMTTTKIDAIASGVVEVILDASVVAKPTSFNSTVSNDVKAALIEFGSVENQSIRGTIYIGDIYQTIENVVGVKHSIINKLTIKPAAIGVNTETVLLWARSILTTSITSEWQLKIVSTSLYQLYKTGVYLGTFSYGVEYTVSELVLNVEYDAGYVNGDTWAFKTYNTDRSIILEELSIPLIFIENLSINVTGGV